MTNMFKPKVEPAPAPPAAVVTPAPPPTMPDMFSPSVLEARRKSMADAGGAGRSSTILSSAASRGGGASNTIAGGATKLGA